MCNTWKCAFFKKRRDKKASAAVKIHAERFQVHQKPLDLFLPHVYPFRMAAVTASVAVASGGLKRVHPYGCTWEHRPKPVS